MKLCTVIKPYQAAYPEPFTLQKGDSVTPGKTDPDNPGWIWCTNQNNESRWVPESYIDDTGIILKDYSSVELTVNTGDKLEILDEEADWYFCRNESSIKGWVPKENVELTISEQQK